MAKELIYSVTSLHLSLNKKNPPDLIIDAHGETRSNNWTNPELQPWIYVQPPPDGVYDFDVWQDLPDDVRGIRVHSETNSETAYLRICQSCRLIDFEEAEVLFFPGVPPQYTLVVRGQKPYLNMKVMLVPLPHIGLEYTPIEVVGCNGTLPTFGPYEEALPLEGLLGTKGIEVIGANRSQKIDVPQNARKVESKAGVRAEKK
jgi:hypothetical protein